MVWPNVCKLGHQSKAGPLTCGRKKVASLARIAPSSRSIGPVRLGLILVVSSAVVEEPFRLWDAKENITDVDYFIIPWPI